MLLSFPRPPGPSNDAQSAIAKLNSVALSAAHIEAALKVLAMLPETQRDHPAAQAAALQAYARDAKLGEETFAAAALHARVAALAKWTAEHDPERQSHAESVLEAAARYPLSDMDGGIAFEAAEFQELILFIEELPW